MKTIKVIIIALLLLLQSCNDNKCLVSDIKEFNQAVAQSKPGDIITLSNGVWKDAELVFEAEGTEEHPITLTVEDKGKVILEGNSNLKMAGTHLVVSGLVFKNGYTPTNEVISFRTQKGKYANNSRLTECVIDNFSNPERHDQDTWIVVYGKNNRIDHNHFEGKSNLGVTMAVRLNTKESQENNHRIDHNYFGPRQNLGANGGETLRIGTSHYSLTNSNTLVEANYFDRCNGEHEIISNKSGKNIYKHNVFYECTGTLTMRHGNYTLVDGNVFMGNGKASTGGIRIINGQQTVVNNYGFGLTGYRFRGALVIMNGVPNSPINRYHQVKDALVENNVFVNCDHVQFCAGSDAERSAIPQNSKMLNNIFYNDKRDTIFTVYDDISGINFQNNILNSNIVNEIGDGFVKQDLKIVKDNRGFFIPQSSQNNVDFTISKDIATKENTGVSWYPKSAGKKRLNSGKVIKVQPGVNTLYEATKTSESGDIIELVSTSETYHQTKPIDINHPLTFRSLSENKPVIVFERTSLFNINNGGSLSLQNLSINGKASPDYSGNAVVSTSKYSMNKNYNLFIENCDVTDLDINHSFDMLKIYKNTFADTISIKNSKFKNISGHIMALDKETDDKGIYNVEYVILKNNIFSDIKGAVLRLYRGGSDESTFGPFLELDHCVFDNVGHGKRNKYKSAVSLYGVQVINIKNNIFNDSEGLLAHLVVGEPIVNILNNNFYNSKKVSITGDQKYNIQNSWFLKPHFTGENYTLDDDSALKQKATDGLNLGVIK